MTRTELFDIPISACDLDHAVEACIDDVDRQVSGHVCFVNVHTLTDSTRDEQLRTALQSARHCFADGVPLVWLSRVHGPAIAGRVCGPDFMDRLLRDERTRAHGFIGGRPGVADKVAARYGVEHVIYSPPLRAFSPEHALDDWDAFLARCPDGVPPPLVWVGLGAPKQEYWISTVSPHAPGVLFLGVGAAFDFLAGEQPRAPRVLQRAGLEWAYRLAREPRRLWKRYLVTNTRFVLLAARSVAKR